TQEQSTFPHQTPPPSTVAHTHTHTHTHTHRTVFIIACSMQTHAHLPTQTHIYTQRHNTQHTLKFKDTQVQGHTRKSRHPLFLPLTGRSRPQSGWWMGGGFLWMGWWAGTGQIGRAHVCTP